MADRGPNPDLSMVKAELRQPLKGAFHTQEVFIPNSSDFTRDRKALTPR